jgi:hypothetical protein
MACELLSKRNLKRKESARQLLLEIDDIGLLGCNRLGTIIKK